MRQNKDQMLGKELAERGFESVTVRKQLSKRRLEVAANKLEPLPTAGAEPLYAPLPVSLIANLDAQGHVQSVEGGTPDPKAKADAASYVKTLNATGQLARSQAAPGADAVLPAGATHTIERDARGRLVLRRKRFSLT